MLIAYSDDGMAFRHVQDAIPAVHDEEGNLLKEAIPAYVAKDGEVLFTDTPTADQLTAAFPNYASRVAHSARLPLIASAQAALDKSDTTVMRCYSASPQVAVPTEWTTYRSELRQIINGTDTTSVSLPITPAYPAGT